MRALFLSFAFILLSGCSSLLTSNEDIKGFYVLNPIDKIEETKETVPLRLGVQRPGISDWLDTERIVLRKEQNQVDYYADSRWVMNIGDMVGMVATESLVNNNIVGDVYYEGSETLSDYILVIDVSDFEAIYRENADVPVVKVTLHAKILAMPDNSLVHTFTTSHETPAAHDDMHSIVEAFDSSLQACMRDLVLQVPKGVVVKNEETL